MIYFAYGSNLSTEQMRNRCPDSQYKENATLDDYEVYFGGSSKHWNGGAFAALRPSNGGRIWGSLFDISDDDVAKLDVIENVPFDYERVMVTAKTVGGEAVQACIYIGDEFPEGIPSPEYIDTIITGANEAKLPQDYIDETFGVWLEKA